MLISILKLTSDLTFLFYRTKPIVVYTSWGPSQPMIVEIKSKSNQTGSNATVITATKPAITQRSTAVPHNKSKAITP